jgi:hypothetical protein
MSPWRSGLVEKPAVLLDEVERSEDVGELVAADAVVEFASGLCRVEQLGGAGQQVGHGAGGPPLLVASAGVGHVDAGEFGLGAHQREQPAVHVDQLVEQGTAGRSMNASAIQPVKSASKTRLSRPASDPTQNWRIAVVTNGIQAV